MIRSRAILISLSAISTAVLVQGCGKYKPPELPAIDYYLVITDSIGVEEGDSNYVLTWPTDATITPDGCVAILDRMKCAALFYSPSGEFLRAVGRPGEGPGEFLAPGKIRFRSEGSFLISCGNGISIFNNSFEYVDRLTWPGFKPFLIKAMDDSSFIAMQISIESVEGQLIALRTLGRWIDTEGPLIEYHTMEAEWVVPDEEMDFKDSRGNNLHACASHSGRVFYARSSIEGIEIFGCEPDGTEFFHVSDYSIGNVRKCEEELQAEEDYYTSHFSRMSGGQPMPVEMKLDPIKETIQKMFVDNEERLWIWLGFYPGAVFRVYDMNGEVLFHAMFDYPGNPVDLQHWAIRINEFGMVAYDNSPEDYPVIYTLTLVEAD